MPEIIIVCVSDDLPQAEGLAEMFDFGGFEVSDDVFSDFSLSRAVAGLLVLSPASLKCERFRDAAQRVIDADKAVVVCLDRARWPLGGAQVFELGGWYGEPEDPALDPVFNAVDRMRTARLRARVSYAPPEAELQVVGT